MKELELVLILAEIMGISRANANDSPLGGQFIQIHKLSQQGLKALGVSSKAKKGKQT